MKKILPLMIATFVSNAVHAADTTGTAVAVVSGGLVVQETVPLNFGVFTAGITAGTITDSGTVTGGVTKVSAGSQNAILVTGTPGAIVNITHDTIGSITNGAQAMTVEYAMIAVGANQIVLRTAPLGGLQAGQGAFPINAKLYVNPNQAPGVYNGTYNITVSY